MFDLLRLIFLWKFNAEKVSVEKEKSTCSEWAAILVSFPTINSGDQSHLELYA